jgi:hypothetical protein
VSSGAELSGSAVSATSADSPWLQLRCAYQIHPTLGIYFRTTYFSPIVYGIIDQTARFIAKLVAMTAKFGWHANGSEFKMNRERVGQARLGSALGVIVVTSWAVFITYDTPMRY